METKTGGVGFLGLLGILFIGLKLTGYINWSWWLVLLPLYGPLALFVAILLVLGTVYGVASLISKR
jgi:hypothetical protein